MFCTLHALHAAPKKSCNGRIWSSRQTQKICPECSDLDLTRKCNLEILFYDKYIGDFERVFGWQNLVVQTDTEKYPECSDPDLARKCHLEIIFHDKYIGDFERLLGWQHLVVQTDTDKMSRML